MPLVEKHTTQSGTPVHDWEGAPPQATQIEEAVLGACLLEEAALVEATTMLQVDDLFLPKHQIIFEAIAELHEAGVHWDLLVLEQHLRDKELLEAAGGAGYLAELTRAVSSAANIGYQAQIIIEKAIKRRAIQAADEIRRKAFDPSSDPYDVLDFSRSQIEQVETASNRQQSLNAAGQIADTLSSTLAIQGNAGGIVGVETYLPLDQKTGGFMDEDVIFLAARPSMGKTAYMLTIVLNMLSNGYDKPILIFSLEMSAHALIQRLLCMAAGVNIFYARTGRLDDQAQDKLVTAAERLGIKAWWNPNEKSLEVESMQDSMLYIQDDPRLNLHRMGAEARRMKHKEGLGIIFTDYLQLINIPPDMKFGTREQEVAYVSRYNKQLAKELGVPNVVLAQLSRKNMTRADKRPQLSDLRESGALEQDADVVVFIHRENYYNEQADPNLAEIIIAKQRNGPTGTCKHSWTKETALFGAYQNNLFDESGWRKAYGFTSEGDNDSINFDDDIPF